MALWAEGDRAVLVVCDGVSSSIDSDVAALAGAERARDVLASLGTEAVSGDDTAVASALVTATEEANKAVIAHTAPDSTNAASATFAAAVVLNDRVHFANLGDSRVYLLTATRKLLLSLDDSMAQAFIAEGMPRAEAESLPRGHAITKWLGRDAIDTVPRTGHQPVSEPGWVVVCSDGLWNYASSPEELATQVDAAAAVSSDPVEIAGRLVVWANGQGGKDNVTVALARVPAGAPTLGATPSDQGKESAENG
jgi:serine/threonine protein phosphatase PrpC